MHVSGRCEQQTKLCGIERRKKQCRKRETIGSKYIWPGRFIFLLPEIVEPLSCCFLFLFLFVFVFCVVCYCFTWHSHTLILFNELYCLFLLLYVGGFIFLNLYNITKSLCNICFLIKSSLTHGYIYPLLFLFMWYSDVVSA